MRNWRALHSLKEWRMRTTTDPFTKTLADSGSSHIADGIESHVTPFQAQWRPDAGFAQPFDRIHESDAATATNKMRISNMPLIFRSSIATIITAIEGARLTTDYVGSASVSSALTFLLSGFQRHKIAANKGTNERARACMGGPNWHRN